MTRPFVLASLFAIAYLGIAIPLLGDYGATWDCAAGDYPYGDRLFAYLETGDERFLSLRATEPRPRVREPHSSAPEVRWNWYQIYPFAATLSGASCRVFWTELGWMPSLEAHNLVVPVFTAMLLFGIVLVSARRFGAGVGATAGLLLLFNPRFMAHGFNNLKDVPEACLYTMAAYAGFLALRHGRWWWVWAGALTGMAFAQKANAVFIPVQLLMVLAVSRLYPRGRPAALTLTWKGIGIATGVFAAVYLACSPPFWVDSVARLRTHLTEILRVGNVLTGGSGSVDTFGGLLHVGVATPLVALAAGVIGVCSRRLGRDQRIFLVLSIVVPVGRTLLPGMRNFDGFRHFMEFLPGLCVLGGLGLVAVGDGLSRLVRRRRAAVLLVAAALATCAWPTIRLHPNGVCYYNAAIGGLAGAQEQEIHGATDYWCNSYRQGAEWLTDHAVADAFVLVPVAPQVAQFEEGARLRDDLRVLRHGDPIPKAPMYVMYVTRKTWYGPLLAALDHALQPVFEIRVQGGPILRILRVDDPALVGSSVHLWDVTLRMHALAHMLGVWLDDDVDRMDAFVEALRAYDPEDGLEPVVERLRVILPPEVATMLGR